jgi:hypothetical protein
MQQRLRELLGDDSGEIRPELQALYDALATTDRPSTVVSWLDKSPAPNILRGLDAQQRLTHATLDDLPASKPVEHLRSVLVAIGTLPPRDEQMTRLERWITSTIAERTDPDEQQLLNRYAVWHLLRRLRRRTEDSETTHNQLVGARQHVRGAIALLDWLADHHLTLATCRQGDLDAWLTDDATALRRETGHFVRWARKQKLTRLDFPAVKWGGPTRVIDTEARWEQARRLLHDHILKSEDRVAGLLVLLYAQWPSAISRLTLEHVQTGNEEVRLHLGREPVVLPEPLAGLVLELVATRRGHAALGDQGTSPWLFPGGQPGRPVSSFQLAERLRQLGLHPGQARSTALFNLATELPAALLPRMLGIHITVAVAWQRASSGDWTRAAEIEDIVDHITRWAVDRRDIIGLLLTGSCARNAARPDSDIDLVLLTNDETHYVDNDWAHELALGEPTRTQSWGAITERRFVTASGLEVEINIGSPAWANINPVDPGTHRVVTDGARPLHDPTGTLARLLHACRPDRQPFGQKP